MPLHIFEERYKAMIGECIDRDQPFGIVLIREGPEVGGPAEPVSIGTTTRIVQVDRLEDGRMNILTKGERRFETTEITQQTPHVSGQVRFLEEPAGELATNVVAEMSEQYSTYIRNLSALAGGWSSQAETPSDPVALAYGVASTMDMPKDLAQELLELHNAAQRMERLLPLLKRANEALGQEVAKRNPFQGPRLN